MLIVSLHLSEVKGPVMERLAGTEVLAHLSGPFHLSQHQAMLAIAERRLAAPTDASGPRVGEAI